MADHSFIKKARQALTIPEDAPFLEAIAPRFAIQKPEDRRLDLMRFDEAQKHEEGLREETQLAAVRRRLRHLDERLRKSGQ